MRLQLLVSSCVVALCASTASAALVHRYSFDGNANDSVGTAHGTVMGNTASYAGGQIVRDNPTGTGSGDFNNGNMPTETIEISYSSMKYQYYAKDAKGQRTGTMEEVSWKVPDSQLFPFDEGCR